MVPSAATGYIVRPLKDISDPRRAFHLRAFLYALAVALVVEARQVGASLGAGRSAA